MARRRRSLVNENIDMTDDDGRQTDSESCSDGVLSESDVSRDNTSRPALSRRRFTSPQRASVASLSSLV